MKVFCTAQRSKLNFLSGRKSGVFTSSYDFSAWHEDCTKSILRAVRSAFASLGETAVSTRSRINPMHARDYAAEHRRPNESLGVPVDGIVDLAALRPRISGLLREARPPGVRSPPTVANQPREGTERVTLDEIWWRAAAAAAAVHQIRNRLQGLMIEAAVIRRGGGPSHAEPCDRIRGMARETGEVLNLFGQLLPRPDLTGACALAGGLAAAGLGELDASAGLGERNVACSPEALAAFLRALVKQGLPECGLAPKRLSAGEAAPGKFCLLMELETAARAPAAEPLPAWIVTTQMARDLGGGIELLAQDPPVLRAVLPAST
jgi:hypothetical protein